VAGSLAAFPKFIKVLILFFRHLPVDGAVRQIALAVRDALCAARLIENDPHYLSVRSDRRDDGSFVISLTGAEFYEQALFADCLNEALGPIENPRYLITRRSLTRSIGREDCHAVPERFGLNKERAELFHRAWRRRLGPSELIYTRSADSRRTLLRARARSFAGAAAASERVDRWV
jgi:hypothetical protein